MQRKVILHASRVGYEITATRCLFQNISLSVQASDAIADGKAARIGLVGRNGSGKSTLLKLLAGQLIPNTGTIATAGSVYYLPQISTLTPPQESVLDWLSTISEEWWTVTTLLAEKFAMELPLSQSVSCLSGGEWTKLWLAIAFAKQPDLLLLDEPTNHLDLIALEQLRQALQEFPGAVVIVSHKPFFLDQVVDTIWELTPEALHVYGGNYSFYRSQKEVEHQTALRAHEVARKELKRAKTAALQEQHRAAQSRQQGRKQAESMPAIVAGARKRAAEVTAGIAKQKHEAAVATATQRMLETKIRTSKATRVQLEERSQKHKNLIDIQGADLKVGDRTLIENMQLHVSSGDRMSIAGVNGSGKSSLAKAILNLEPASAHLQSGEVLCLSSLKAVYLDQNYALINRKQTVLENMQSANRALNYQLLRQQLGHFLFFNDDVYKPASSLSGGELARLAIAIISISEIDWLILDEPTNNLDLETVDHIVSGLNEFQGVLWVISHDIDFLSRIGIQQAYQLKHRQLQPLLHQPGEAERYYQELLVG
jgi:ATPase subunit of ABC transporter with duplicated ATPase domains